MKPRRNPRTVAEMLLEPNARGFATPPAYIRSVLHGHTNMETYLRIGREQCRLRSRRLELGALSADEKTIARMLWEMVRGGNAR